MTHLDEASFIKMTSDFIATLRGPEQFSVGGDQDLIADVGLSSLELIALLQYVERLRNEELLDVPDFQRLTLRSVYELLYDTRNGRH